MLLRSLIFTVSSLMLAIFALTASANQFVDTCQRNAREFSVLLEGLYRNGHDKQRVRDAIGKQELFPIIDAYYELRKSNSAEAVQRIFVSSCDHGNNVKQIPSSQPGVDRLIAELGITETAAAAFCSGHRTAFSTKKHFLHLEAGLEIFAGRPMDNSQYQQLAQKNNECIRMQMDKVLEVLQKIYFHPQSCPTLNEAVGRHFDRWSEDFTKSESLSGLTTALNEKNLNSWYQCRSRRTK